MIFLEISPLIFSRTIFITNFALRDSCVGYFSGPQVFLMISKPFWSPCRSIAELKFQVGEVNQKKAGRESPKTDDMEAIGSAQTGLQHWVGGLLR